MKSMMQILAGCLLLFAGCRSSNLLSGWTKGDAAQRSAVNSEGGLPEPSRQRSSSTADSTPNPKAPAASSGNKETIAEHVRRGQDAIAAWYQDERNSHLTTAQQQFEAALKLDQQNVDAHHGLAIVGDLKRDFATAEQHYQQALRLAPANSRILGDLGYSCLLQNRLEDSEAYLNRALAHDPNNQNAIKHLGDVYARKGQTDLARSTYRRVLNEAEIERALASNLPSGNTGRTGDSPRKKNSSDEAFAADLQRRFEEKRQLQAQSAAHTSPQAPRSTPTGDELRERLAMIDQDRRGNLQTGAIFIGDPGEPVQRLPGSQLDSSADAAPWAGPADLTANVGTTQIFPGVDHRGAPVAGPITQPQNSQGASEFNWANPAGRTAQATSTSSASELSPLQQPWGQEVVPALGTAANPALSPAVYANQPTGTTPQATGVHQLPAYNQRDNYPQGVPPGGTAFQSSASAVQTGQGTADASRQAALMGMGFGPGTMFPMFSNNTPTLFPGSNSMMNGAAVPEPQRYLPAQPQPVDLGVPAASFTPPGGQMQNQWGQAVPTGTPLMSQPVQLGTPAAFHTGQGSVAPANGLQPYQQQTQQASATLNSAGQQQASPFMQFGPAANQGVQQAVGQFQIDPQSGVQYTLPQPQTVHPQTMQPTGGQQLPQYPRTADTGNFAVPPGANGSFSPGTPAGNGVVIPESYQNRNRGPATSAAEQPFTPPAWAVSPGGTEQLPAIIPGKN